MADVGRGMKVFVLAAAAVGCAGVTPLYPPRPRETPAEPLADPTPARVVVHATIRNEALRAALDEALPVSGEGTFPLLGSQRKFVWKRDPIALGYVQGRISVELHVSATADMPISHLDFPLDLRILAEPVVSADYLARLQSTEVQVTSKDKLVKVADIAASVLDKVKGEVQTKLDEFRYDLRPLLAEANQRIGQPIPLALGKARGCAALGVLGVEAGPTVLADGIEKDIALVIAPSVTIPCTAMGPAPDLPPLANVAAIPSGPFTVTIPIAARYDELARAMTVVFKDGKYYFSKEYPGLYMEKPEVYASHDQLVLKLHIAGPIKRFFFDTIIDGDIYMAGHPTVVDNELRVPDLEPTIETSSLLLKLKAALDGTEIRDQARAALRLDIGERIHSVRSKLSSDLAFGDGRGCVKATADKIEVTGVHAHAEYLRVYVTVTARASIDMPCPNAT